MSAPTLPAPAVRELIAALCDVMALSWRATQGSDLLLIHCVTMVHQALRQVAAGIDRMTEREHAEQDHLTRVLEFETQYLREQLAELDGRER